MAHKVRKDWHAPSAVAVSARLRSGAGKHGGTARQQHRRDRAAAKRELRG